MVIQLYGCRSNGKGSDIDQFFIRCNENTYILGSDGALYRKDGMRVSVSEEYGVKDKFGDVKRYSEVYTAFLGHKNGDELTDILIRCCENISRKELQRILS